IGTGAPPSGSEAAAPAAAPPGGPGPAVGPGPMPEPMPTLRPGEAFYVLRICGPDKRRLCGDVPPGGGRIIACLAENASTRPIVPRRSPPHAGNIEIALRKPATPVIAHGSTLRVTASSCGVWEA